MSNESSAALPTGAACSTALTDVEEVRARHQTIRDRLAARRQQRENLLASASVSRLPSDAVASVHGTGLKTPVALLASQLTVPRSKAISLMTMNSLLKPSGFTRVTVGPSDAKHSAKMEVVKEPGDKVAAERSTTPSGELTDQPKSHLCESDNVTAVNSSAPCQSHIDCANTAVPASLSKVALEVGEKTETIDSSNATQTRKSRKHPAEDERASDKVKRAKTSRRKHPDELSSSKTTCKISPRLPETTAAPSQSVGSDAARYQLTGGHCTGDRHQPITVPSDADRETVFRTELEDLLGAETAREKENKRTCKEILELLNTPTAKERYLSEKFRTQGGSQVQQFCSHGTRAECTRARLRFGDPERCSKLHFRKIIHPHTDESLGDCSFLNTCFHVDTCKYVHYTIDHSDQSMSGLNGPTAGWSSQGRGSSYETEGSGVAIGGEVVSTRQGNQESSQLTLYPPQWINCDIRLINMSVLGKFAVIMADPPWDIHMELPYGTMSDEEMRRMDIPCLQDDGYLFLWVTGRAMELGRECLRLWGYQRVDEIIWVKTNQLQRLIRTGRTGHWLNHGKEHCLVGVKGNPQGVNIGLDCDVIVSEVRETSHKPDEIYGIIERLSPGTRKLELFGRPHNLQPNWITIGNQLEGTYLVDPSVVERFKKQYPNGLDTKGR